MSAKQLRQRFLRTFRGMSKYRRTTAWGIFSAYVLQIAGSIGLGHYLLSEPVTALSGAAVVLLGMFIATRLRGLNNIVHECSHATFSENLRDNTVIGSLSASISLGCFRDYRDEHMTHHANVGDYENDLDLQGIEALRIDEALSPRVILRHAVTPFILRHLPYYLRANFTAGDGRGYQALKIGLVVATALLAVVAPLTAIFMVIIPFAFFYTTLNYWTDCFDHAGISMSGDDLDSSRNVLAPWLLRVIFFPRNDSYHLVHHLFPQVPARHLPQTHKTLCADEIYQAKDNAVRPFWKLGKHTSEEKVRRTM